jgi:hypothetical protein
MIGKPEWFKYRIFGWGVAPKTWQGWVYGAVAAFLIAGSLSISIIDSAKMWLFAVLMGLFILDILHIMTQLPKVSDERENCHQLIIERNCSFAAIFTLAGVALYQAYRNAALLQNGLKTLPFDSSILIVMGAMLTTKVLSYAYVNWKM